MKYFLLLLIPFLSSWTHIELGAGNYGTESYQELTLLSYTLEALVSRYGEEGTFYINDIEAQYAKTAEKYLKAFAQSRGYDSIDIALKVGDIKSAFFLKNLEPVDSMHLKNFDENFYGKRSDREREQTREALQRLANQSKTGLTLFFVQPEIYVPNKEWDEFFLAERFYQKTIEWPPLPYFHPTNSRADAPNGFVYFIPPVRETGETS